jgi:ribosomal protein S27E
MSETMKVECENCGRKAVVRDDDDPRAKMRYCRRCGAELPTWVEP